MKKLTSAQDAIEQAIKGGYSDLLKDSEWIDHGKIAAKPYRYEIKFKDGGTVDVGAVFTDPLFWQALGKARGWKPVSDDFWEGESISEWLLFAHRWLENRMVGGDEQKFWERIP